MRLFPFLIILNLFQLNSFSQKKVVFPVEVSQFFDGYCISCHGPKKKKGGLRIDHLDPDFINGKDASEWQEVLDVLNKGEMPPEDEKQPSSEVHNKVAEFLTEEIKKAVVVKRNQGGKVVMRRLTNYEYDNTVNDLLALDLNYSMNFVPDSSSDDGFKNNASLLGISPVQIENYITQARFALDNAIYTYPQPEFQKIGQDFSKLNKEIDGLYKQKKKKSNKKKKKARESDKKYLLTWKKYPSTGKILIKIQAASRKAQAETRMRLRVGYRVGEGQYLYKTVDTETLTSRDFKTLTYSLNIEDCPIPDENAKFPELLFILDEFKPASTSSLDLAIKSINVEGPIYDSWPPQSHKQIFIPSKLKYGSDAYARELLKNFMHRAWRRAVSSSELEAVFKIYKKKLKHGFIPAIKQALTSVLVSPNFLYILEPVSKSSGKESLSSFELASRLSYFLWSSMPDEELLALAKKGRLSDSALLKKEVARLLNNPKSWNFVENFTTQWLHLGSMHTVAINPRYYPDFNKKLKDDMKLETLNFFKEVLDKNLSSLNFIDSDFTMLNNRLAEHYKIPFPVDFKGFKRVNLKSQDKRGGVLTHGSVLLSNSTGDNSHAILRGVWLLDRVLGDPPPSPPANVPTIDPNHKDFAQLPLKKQLALHVEDPACARCHIKIDPLGIAFESYDATGAWRTQVKRFPTKSKKPVYFKVDDNSRLRSGVSLNGLSGLKKYLLKYKKEQFAENLVRRMLTYALGRSLEFGDEAEVEELTSKFIKNNYKLASLVKELVLSDAFQKK